jgi:hypothetical protein
MQGLEKRSRKEQRLMEQRLVDHSPREQRLMEFPIFRGSW